MMSTQPFQRLLTQLDSLSPKQKATLLFALQTKSRPSNKRCHCISPRHFIRNTIGTGTFTNSLAALLPLKLLEALKKANSLLNFTRCPGLANIRTRAKRWLATIGTTDHSRGSPDSCRYSCCWGGARIH